MVRPPSLKDEDDDEGDVDDVDKVDDVALGRDLSAEEFDRRELCPVHGWVGRRAFRRDLHHTCVLGDPAAPVSKEKEHALSPDHDELPRVQIGDGRRRVRNPALRRARTVARKRLTHSYMEAEALKIDHFIASSEYAAHVAARPKTRGDCKDGVRPCPWISCSAHLYLDVNPATGTIKLNFPDRELDELRATCALDVADEGIHTLEQVGEFMNLTRERVRQVEVRGFFSMRGLVKDPNRDDD
jgi:hypothetical protein